MSTKSLRDDHILRSCHFDVGITSLDKLHLCVRHQFHYHCIIRNTAAVCSGCKYLLVGAVDQTEAECLRCLDLP